MYTYLVIGKGLFGAAAARYLSQTSARVALIGPDEPTHWATHDGVFASHYDEARIVSQSAPDADWMQLDHASIAAYPTIEAQSGVRFFTPSGRLSAIPRGGSPFYPYLAGDGANCTELTHQTMHTRYGYQLPSNYTLVFEDAPSGHLNPRAMVRAQVAVAHQQGAEIIRQRVARVRHVGTHIEVVLADNSVISAEKVLLAAGAFTNCFELVERKLALKPETIVTVLGEVSAETAAKFAQQPPLNYRQHDHRLPHLSILPPLRYPDGRTYLKLVPSSDIEGVLPDFDALGRWFRAESRFAYRSLVQKTAQTLLPDIEFLSWHSKPCVICYTPSRKPIIDCLADGRLYVAAGGNGGSAHPSDAIGKLAADFMIHNRWMSTLDHTPFRLRFADDWAEWMQTPTTAWSSRETV